MALLGKKALLGQREFVVYHDRYISFCICLYASLLLSRTHICTFTIYCTNCYSLPHLSPLYKPTRLWPPQRSRIFTNPLRRFLPDFRATLLPSMPSSSMRTCNRRIMRLLEQIQSLKYCSSTSTSWTRRGGNLTSAMF
jgi:hypothetical protein